MKKLTSLFLIIIFLSCDNSKSEWLVLFDGKSVSGLRGYKMDSFPWGSWAIEDGSLKTVPDEKGIDIISMPFSPGTVLRLPSSMAHDPHGKESILYPLKPKTLLPSKSTSHSDLLASHDKKIMVRNNDVNFFMFFLSIFWIPLTLSYCRDKVIQAWWRKLNCFILFSTHICSH